METRDELAVLCVYIENQAILEPILIYHASKYKQTQKQVARTVYGPICVPSCETNICIFLLYRSRCGHVMVKLNHNVLRCLAETVINTISRKELRIKIMNKAGL